MKRAKSIVSGIVWTVVGLYLLLVILLHIPVVQGFIGHGVSSALSSKLGARVEIGRVDLGFANRLIIDDVLIYDRQGAKMFRATRLSAKVDYIPLMQGRVSISSLQVFGMRAVLYKATAKSAPNYQFVIDSFASKDTTKSTPFELHVASLLIRHGAVKYDNRYVTLTNKFSPNHINAKDISAHIIVNTLTQDSLDVNVKKISLNDASGLEIKSLALRFKANKNAAELRDFALNLPKSSLNINSLDATYKFNNGKFDNKSLAFNGAINASEITPADLKFMLPQLHNMINTIHFYSSISGTSKQINIKNTKIAAYKDKVYLTASARVDNWTTAPRWYCDINNLRFDAQNIENIVHNLGVKATIPKPISNLKQVTYRGAAGGEGKKLFAKGTIQTAAGNANIDLNLQKNKFTSIINTRNLDLRKVTDNEKLGYIATNIMVSGELPFVKERSDLYAKGTISSLDYNSYTYRNLAIDGTLHNGAFNGTFGMNDPNGQITLKGNINLLGKTQSGKLEASVKNFNPQALNLSNSFTQASFNFNASADFTGNDFNSANGTFDITDFRITSPTKDYTLSTLHVEAKNIDNQHTVSMESDFGTAEITGSFDYSTVVQSFTNLIASKLPTIPGLPKHKNLSRNNFNITATIYNTEWLQQIFDVPLQINKPMEITGNMRDDDEHLNLIIDAPNLLYAGKEYDYGNIDISTQGDTLRAYANVNKVSDNGNYLALSVNAAAANNTLSTTIVFEDPILNNLNGTIKTDTRFSKTLDGFSAVNVDVHRSRILLGDSTWFVQPSSITYSNKHLQVNNFAVRHNNQHLIINGQASENQADSIIVDLKDLDVSYILALVNFRSVRFGGAATGRAFVSNVFGKEPQAAADLVVNNFKFQDSNMGVLSAKVDLNHQEQRIDINAIANDGPSSMTFIDGYVSPQQGNIDLNFSAQNTRMEFIESFCGSFMSNANIFGIGNLRLYGPLKAINLTGSVTANGSIDLTPLNTTYTMHNAMINLVPNEIRFINDTIYDRASNKGVLSGSVYHENLKNVSYNLDIKAKKLLSYDTHDFGSNTFYGTIYATGDCNIHGKSGEVTIDIDATPDEESTLVYDVASPDGIANNEFIHWTDSNQAADSTVESSNSIDIMNDRRTDIRINLLINTNQNATIKLIMDKQAGDYISLNGDGIIRASYYNKGDFTMNGNYVVDHGIYKLTIQNVIKKDFIFNPGGTIAFEGNPYNANLNLEAQYTVNAVSLSDLNLGSTFAENNIRVNCLMNITGTPNAPKVDFSLDMPTVNNDAKQMIYSLINGQEDMNQQVLYLLAIGRFYNSGNNNASAESAARQSQTSIAMQSILSGTLSAQINNVLSTVVNNNNWNLGANISTGDQGWNNAEYEGLLSGRLLNNRLLINGQFGYRDNANATTSFIGDFDIRYLLFPNGNLAVRVYNQANDRYFTKNSLNTQGIGLIIKRDFNGWRDLFGIKPKKQNNDTILIENKKDSINN